MSGKEPKTIRSRWCGRVRLIDTEDELELTRKISLGKKYLSEDDCSLTEEQRELKKEAINSIYRLVEAYSVLIEKIAKENYQSVDSGSVDYDDFVAEAYIVALQCARNFDPGKGKTPIRFSSYVSRAISSSLMRMSLRSRTSLYVPTSVMSKARKWVHTHFEMVNKGIPISDEEVSAISGVDFTQNDVKMILETSASSSIEEDSYRHPSVTDKVKLDELHKKQRDALCEAIKESFGADSDKALLALGLKDGVAVFSGFLLKSNSDSSPSNTGELGEFLLSFRSLINHPLVRMRIKDDLEVRLNQ